MAEFHNSRYIDPFYEEAVNTIFEQPDKTAFVMDGPIGTGKTTNFLMRGGYEVAQHVSPRKQGNKQFRESLWAFVRESENAAVATLWQVLANSIFSPEILAQENTPVKQYGSHPTTVEIKHQLADKTWLVMRIECHGFNNEGAANRLRTREFLGGMIPEMQGVPWHIFETLVERCGRWRTEHITITKKIKGQTHTLSGVTGLAIVLCDVNIPPRGHEMYPQYYDRKDKAALPTLFLRPPPPILHFPVEKATDEQRAKYPVTQYEGKRVIWVPNPKVYNMTRHFEETDSATGKKIPWSGYKYWFKRLHSNDSHIRRYIIGLPDTVGGIGAIYKTFTDDETTVKSYAKLPTSAKIWVGFDPGSYAAAVLLAEMPNGSIHCFKEFCTDPIDRVSTRMLFNDFVFPWCRKHLAQRRITIVPDPAATFLGKNIAAGNQESLLSILKDVVRDHNQTYPAILAIKIVGCRVPNQNVDFRINALGYYIEKQLFTIDGEACPVTLGGLRGGYCMKTLKDGTLSDTIDKNEFSHPVEAVQYPVVNIRLAKKKVETHARRRSDNTGTTRLRHARR